MENGQTESDYVDLKHMMACILVDVKSHNPLEKLQFPEKMALMCRRLFRDRRTINTLLVIVLCAIVMLVNLLSVHQRDIDKVSPFKAADVSYPRAKFTVNIATSSVIATVDEKFISVGIPWRTLVEWNFTAAEEKQITALTKALSPAYARIGGTAGDFVLFNDLEKTPEHFVKQATFNINGKDLDRINQIAEKAGWQVLFTLSLLRRSKNGSWDSSNPLKIVKYAAGNGYKFGWELGNGK